MQADTTLHRARTAVTGMTFFLGSWAMMFSGLLFCYGLLRAHAPVWPPPTLPPFPQLLPAVSTLVLVALSVTLHGADRRWRLVLATLFGVAFLLLQVAGGLQAAGRGITLDAGPFASFLYLLAGFHAAHVVIGVGALAVLLCRPFARITVQLRVWTYYWHFLGLIWGVIYVWLFLA